MNEIHSLPITFSPSAIHEIKRLRTEQPNHVYLRIGAKGGGCSGLSYVLEFDEKEEGDLVFEIEGVSCIMHPSHSLYLNGMEIHWENGLNNRGFSFINPNASKTCGCGTSFAV